MPGLLLAGGPRDADPTRPRQRSTQRGHQNAAATSTSTPQQMETPASPTAGLSPDETATTAIAFMLRGRVWVRSPRHRPHGADRHRQRRVLPSRRLCAAAARVEAPTDHPVHATPQREIERYNRIISEEFVYARTWTSEETTSKGPQSLEHPLQHRRPYSTANGLPPASRLRETVSNVVASYT
jgi:hypothetical protein